MKLTLVVIRTEKMDALAQFYQKLGIEFDEQRHGAGPNHFCADVEGTTFEIYPAKKPEDVDKKTRLGFSIKNLKEKFEVFKIDPQYLVVDLQESEWGLRAIVSDPDGRAVELYDEVEK